VNAFSIHEVFGREILDSRGHPTVEAEVSLAGGAVGRASVPSGASTGSREAIELRDKDSERYGGRGVLEAVAHINDDIQRVLRGHDARDHKALDRAMMDLDGSKDNSKSRLGANAVLAVSLAGAHASAAQLRLSLYEYLRKYIYARPDHTDAYVLPLPMLNFINGGAHAHNALDFQEVLLLPRGARTFPEALEWASRVYLSFLSRLRDQHGEPSTNFASYGVGDEGGFSIRVPQGMGPNGTVEFILSILTEVVTQAGYSVGRDGSFAIALDAAASEFFDDGSYLLGGRQSGKPERWSSAKLVAFYEELVDNYEIVSIEDGMAEGDEHGWKILTERLGQRIQLVGDDLFATNPEILREGIRSGIANAVLVKVNQIGTLTEAIDVVQIAQQNEYRAIISHRSGETEDTTISDIAVAVNAGQIKTGCLSRADRVAKYNRLLRISRELGDRATFRGDVMVPAAPALVP